MICSVCESDKFTLQEGVYFCIECSTQIQGTRDETIEVEGLSRRTLVSSPASERSFKKESKLYSVWTTTEAYNIIICEQVSALINLGASDKLKDVVLYIWSRYLQKCEVAFWQDDQSEEQLPRLSVYAKKRDKKVLYGDKFVGRKKKNVKSKLNKKKPTSISKKKSKVVEVEESSDTSEAEKEGSVQEDELNSDCVLDDSSKDESCGTNDDELSDQKKRNEAYSSHALKHKDLFGGEKKKNVSSATKELCVDYMTLSKTLCFCYLGLLYTGDQLLLSDLIRFAHEGRIPYLNATNCFPATMKLQCDDHSSFNTSSTPDLWKISLICAKLIDFIALPKFKHPSLIPIVFRFVKDLNLPDNIICIVKILIDKTKKQGSEWYETKKMSKIQYLPIPLYEVQAMASIIVVLKMFLVLDGKYEQEHSEVMTKINILLKDRKLFVWNQWKQQASLIEYLFMKPGSSYSDFSLFDSLSAAQIISKYPFILSRENGDFPNKSSYVISTARHRIKNIFMGVNPLNDIRDKPEPTSFPLKQQIAYLMTEWRNLPMYRETRQIDFSFLSENFSSHQLFFKHSNSDTPSEDLINLLFSSLYESAEILTLNHSASNYQNVLRSSSKYWFKNFSQKLLGGSSSTWLDTLPTSFQWLLRFLCKYVKISCKEMYCEVLNMEKELFLHAKRTKH